MNIAAALGSTAFDGAVLVGWLTVVGSLVVIGT